MKAMSLVLEVLGLVIMLVAFGVQWSNQGKIDSLKTFDYKFGTLQDVYTQKAIQATVAFESSISRAIQEKPRTNVEVISTAWNSGEVRSSWLNERVVVIQFFENAYSLIENMRCKFGLEKSLLEEKRVLAKMRSDLLNRTDRATNIPDIKLISGAYVGQYLKREKSAHDILVHEVNLLTEDLSTKKEEASAFYLILFIVGSIFFIVAKSIESHLEWKAHRKEVTND